MKMLLFTLALVLALCAAWLAFPSRPNGRAAPLSPGIDSTKSRDGSGAKLVALDPHRNHGTGSKDANAARDLVFIRSREGFTLYSIELALPDGTWQPVELEDSAVPRATLAGAASLRAPGHRPHVVDREAREITLDVDALLIVESDALDACIDPIDMWQAPTEVHEGPGTWMCCAQRLDSRRLGLAVTCDGITLPGGAAQAHLWPTWKAGHVGSISFDARPGMREHLDMPCPPVVARAPLVVTVEAADHVPLQRPLVTIAEVQARASEKDESSKTVVQTFAWGSMQMTAPDAYSESLAALAEPREVTFDDAPTGIPLVLTVFDRDTKAWSVATFVHDGTPRRVVLHPPVVVTGSFARADPRVAWPDLKLEWTQRYDESSEPAWKTRGDALRLERDGSFEAHGPGEILDHGEHGDAIPRIVDVTVTATGTAPWSKRFTMDATGHVDCGVIDLAEVTPDVRVILDGTEKMGTAMEGREIVLGWADGTCQVAIIELLRQREDVAEICLSNTGSAKSAHGKTRTWSMDGAVRFEPLQVERAVRMVTAPMPRWGRAANRPRSEPTVFVRGFTLVSGNTFRAVPSADYEITVVTDPAAPPLYVGVAWQGVPEDQGAGQRLSRGAHESVIRVSAPDARLSVWWIREDEGLSQYHVPNLEAGFWSTVGPGSSRVVIPEIEGAK
jgi:hypothetical protein